MQFSWNDKKDLLNIQKHGIDFEDAKRLFFGTYIEDIDDRVNYGEERMIAQGYVDGQPIIVVYTQPNENNYHLISARRSLPKEEAELMNCIGIKKARDVRTKIARKKIPLHKRQNQS